MAKKKIVSAATAVATALVTLSPAFAANFTDVKDDASYAKSVNRLKALGIVSGDANGNFNPDQSLERAQAAKLLVGALAKAASVAGENKFSDVTGWAVNYVNVAAAQGYVKGYGNGKFGPTDKVTNAQFLAMALRALGKNDEALGLDAKTKWDDKVTKYLAAAKDAKLIDGLDLDPTKEAKRSDVAVIVNNLLNTDVDGSTLYENVKKDLGVQVVNGTVDSVDGKTIVIAGKAYVADSVPAGVEKGAIVKFDAKDDIVVSDVTVVSKPTVVNANYNVVSIVAVDNTHITVTFDSAIAGVNATDFTFDGGLVATDAKVDGKVVTVTTSAQKADKYIVSYNGKIAGAFTGIAPKEIVAITAPVADTISVVNPDGTTVNQTVAGTNYSVKSVQALVGGKVTVTAKTTAGATLTFKVVSPNGSLNAQYTKDVVADANGVAKFDYSRTSADADTLIIAAKGNETQQDIVKVYWGVKPILTVTPDKTTPKNGNISTFTVKLTNPVTGDPMKNKTLKVVFKENIAAEGTRATASVVGVASGERLYQDIPSSNSADTTKQTHVLSLTTDSTGTAQFIVLGNHDKVTPIVFYDARKFFDEGLYDSTQYIASFAGDEDGKFDAIELNAISSTVEFQNYKYDIQSDDKDSVVASDSEYDWGRKYTITVKKEDGSAYAGGVANIALNEIVQGYDTRARIVLVNPKDDKWNATDADNFIGLADGNNVVQPNVKDPNSGVNSRYLKVAVKLDSAGKASFYIATDRPDTKISPIIWIDGDTPDVYTGKTNGAYDASLDYSKVLASTWFVNKQVINGKLVITADDKVDDSVKVSDDAAIFKYFLYNQNAVAGSEQKAKEGMVYARLNFVVENPSEKNIEVDASILSNVTVDQQDWVAGNKIVVKPHQTRTIAGDYVGISTSDSVAVLKARQLKDDYTYEKSSGGGKLKVTATAALANGYGNWTKPTEWSKYTTATTATVTFVDKAAVLTQVELVPGTYVGTVLKATPDNLLKTDLSKDIIYLLLPNNRVVGIPYDSADVFKAGKKTTISTTDKLTANDFTQATILTNDIVLGINKDDTALKKFESSIKSDDDNSANNSALMVKWNGDAFVNEFTALYPDYNTDRANGPYIVAVSQIPVGATVVATNNVGATDTVKVTGVTAGDVVKVYLNGSATALATTAIADATGTATVNLDLGAAAGNVKVTVTSTGKAESVLSLSNTITFAAENAGLTAADFVQSDVIAGALFTVVVDKTKVQTVTLTFNGTSVSSSEKNGKVVFAVAGTYTAGSLKITGIDAQGNSFNIVK